MKVWVVSDGYDYEGYGEPLAVFSKKEHAEALVAKVMAKRDAPDICRIHEYELDAAPAVLDDPA